MVILFYKIGKPLQKWAKKSNEKVTKETTKHKIWLGLGLTIYFFVNVMSKSQPVQNLGQQRVI